MADPRRTGLDRSRGASRTAIYSWLNEDLSEVELDEGTETRGRHTLLEEDQIHLLVGFVLSTRLSRDPVSLETMQDFCSSHLGITPPPTLSRTIRLFGFTSQKAMTRNSRLVSEEVVEDALGAIEEIRSYGFPPNRIIAMDETGLWSNVTNPRPITSRIGE